MKIEIITIGDEILIGQVVDTNSAWMGAELNKIGAETQRITSISDDRTEIISTLNEALERADVVLITGGLGPTRDDITKHVLCEYFHTKLVFSQEVYDDVETYCVAAWPISIALTGARPWCPKTVPSSATPLERRLSCGSSATAK
jgi:nicotinamide-nucleotide amidase